MATTLQAGEGRKPTFAEKYLTEERVMDARDRRNLHVTAAVLIAVGAVAFGVILVSVLLDGGVTAIDVPLQQWFNSMRNDSLTVLMVVVATAFGPVALPIIIVVVVALWMIFSRKLWRPLLLAAGTAAGLIAVQVITRVVQRPRPEADLMLLGTDTTFSFPSGHVMGAADFLLLVAFLVLSRRESRTAQAIGFIVASILVVLTASCRLYLGYHWATDALASVSLSLVVLGTVIAIDTHHTVRVPE